MTGIDYRAFVVIAPVALAALVVATSTVWRYRRRYVAESLIWYLIMVGVYLGANLMELLTPSVAGTIAWARVSYAFLFGSGMAWLAFALVYAGFESLVDWKHFRWLTVLPVAFIAFFWFASGSDLVWTDPGIHTVAGFTTMRPLYGTVFWVSGVYLYGLLTLGVALFLFTGIPGRRAVRRQSSIISLAAVIPVFFNLLHVFRVLPGLRKDYTPVAFALSGIFFYVAVHRFNLLKVAPIHRQVVLEDVSSAVIALDPDGTVLDFNGRAEEFLGINADVIGKDVDLVPALASLLQNVPLDQRNNFETPWSNPRLVHTPGHNADADEAAVEAAAGTQEDERHFDVWIKPLHHLSGRHAGAIITLSDVSGWVSLLEERNRAYKRLEAEQNRLIQLQLQLRRQEQLATIGQLAAGMAHEISNPLTYIRSGFRELKRLLQEDRGSRVETGTTIPADQSNVVRKPSTEHETAEIIRDIDIGLDRIEGVVKSLNDFSRGISHRKTRSYVDFSEIVKNAVTLTTPELRGVQLTVESSMEVNLFCGSDEISQVLLNLLLNAVHAVQQLSATAEKRIGIAYRGAGDTLVCSVTDNGPGVDNDIRDRIFDPFFTSRPDNRGTGLGLSISRDIVQNGHGGRLYLADGLPTTFIMELPLGCVD